MLCVQQKLKEGEAERRGGEIDAKAAESEGCRLAVSWHRLHEARGERPDRTGGEVERRRAEI